MFGHRFFGARYWGPRYWGPAAAVAVEVAADTHDGGWYSRKEYEELQRQAERARRESDQKRKANDQRLVAAINRAYRRVVEREPDLADEVLAELAPAQTPLVVEPEQSFTDALLASIDWGGLADQLAAAERLLAIYQARLRTEQAMADMIAADEDDIETLLLLAA